MTRTFWVSLLLRHCSFAIFALVVFFRSDILVVLYRYSFQETKVFSVGTNHVSVMVCHEITTVRIAADPDALAVFTHPFSSLELCLQERMATA